MSQELFYYVLLVVWLLLAVAAFIALLLKPAPYGRFAGSARGPKVSPRLAWLLMESPAVILFTLFFLAGENKNAVAVAFLVIWNVHYVYRGFVYPCLKRSNRAVPISVVAAAMCFQAVNTYLQARYLFEISPRYPLSWLLSLRFIGGVALFAVGWAIMVQSDTILRRLRSMGNNEYQIPRGGLFGWVSCPNYFGEILEWSAWALLTWSPAGLVFAIWTAANLVPRAIAHGRWYRREFPDYPAERKAVFPYLL